MTKSRNLRRKFSEEFKEEAVRLWTERRKASVPIGSPRAIDPFARP